jgi:transcriptional regulator with XRE-family HTH domain
MVLAPPAPYYRLMPKKREPTNLVEPKTPLGRFVRDERGRQGDWSQDELAARANATNPELSLTFTSISNIERGKTVLPDPPVMIGIAQAFGMHVCDLYVAAGYSEFGAYGSYSRRIEDDDAEAVSA